MDDDLARQRLRLWLHMLKSVRHMEQGLRERFRGEYAMTLPRFDVMALLDRMPDGANMSQISDGLMISNGNVTGIVARLADDGLVERIAAPGDRRATTVRLTPEGRALMDRMAHDHLGWIDGMMAGLDEADIARGIALMIEMRKPR